MFLHEINQHIYAVLFIGKGAMAWIQAGGAVLDQVARGRRSVQHKHVVLLTAVSYFTSGENNTP